jgi:hypothetical protein
MSDSLLLGFFPFIVFIVPRKQDPWPTLFFLIPCYPALALACIFLILPPLFRFKQHQSSLYNC